MTSTFPETSLRTGPWPPARRAQFRVPACAHVLLSPLPGIPETACGADADDPHAARLRCGAEAVERITAWQADTATTAGSASPRVSRLDPDLFAQEDCRPVPSGQDALVHELLDADTLDGLFLIDRAAVSLGTTGWFPAGSTGYAAAPTRAEAIVSAAWEVLERDLLTAWWRGAEPAVRQGVDHQDSEELKADGIEVSAVRIGDHCTAVVAFDRARELAAVGSSAGADDLRRCVKATQEALITLAQLRHLLTARTVADRNTLDNPAEAAMGLEDTLLLLLDPRFAAQITSRFEDIPSERTDPVRASDDPVRVLRGRGHRVFVAELRSPESEWAGLTVVRVLAAGASNPLPRGLRPTELPVPLA